VPLDKEILNCELLVDYLTNCVGFGINPPRVMMKKRFKQSSYLVHLKLTGYKVSHLADLEFSILQKKASLTAHQVKTIRETEYKNWA